MEPSILASIDSKALGAELKRTRQQRKMRQEDAAQIIDVARTTMIAIENGDRRIRSDELVKLARAYGRSVGDFVRPRPTIERFTRVQFRAPLQQSDEEQEQIDLAINLMEDLCRDYLELEQIAGQPLIRAYPPEYQHSGESLEIEAENLAQAERSRLGLGDGPLPPLRDVLEQDVGIRIFYIPLDPWKLSAMYYYSDLIGACIVVNSKHREDRCRWSLTHDYCHFLADRQRPSIEFNDGYQRMPGSERFADAFAGHFLMPAEKLAQRFNGMKQQGPVRTRDILILANRYGVSLQAMVLRLEKLRLLNTGTWDKISGSNFKTQEAQRELGLGEVPGRRDMFPLHYRRLAIEAYHEGKITEGRLARFLHADRLTVREIAEESEAAPDTSGVQHPSGESSSRRARGDISDV
ncbi:MAG: ImmA/IrrE family metallo-endopeptidase [Oscillochloris sp.]|nr:ImmA/IrrE family metallo-endopeptidase [Oscillochloris sp.]